MTTEKSIPNPPACHVVVALLSSPMHLSVQSYPSLTFRCEIHPLANICNSTRCICTRYNKHIIHRYQCV